MDEGMIVQDYRLAKDGEKQIRIMAQLGGIPVAEIVEILRRAGVYDASRGRKKADQSMRGKVDYGRVRMLYDAGMNDHEIGRRMGISSRNILLWRRRDGRRPNLRR
jgi:hypothetical protein